MAGYWPSSFLAFLLTETTSRLIKTQKKNDKRFITWPKRELFLAGDGRVKSRVGMIGPS